jgi:hypothetical protein
MGDEEGWVGYVYTDMFPFFFLFVPFMFFSVQTGGLLGWRSSPRAFCFFWFAHFSGHVCFFLALGCTSA